MTERTPPVFVIGSGAVATTLAAAMRHAGVPVLGLLGRSEDRVRAAAARAGVAGFTGAPTALLGEADVIILAVRDAAISEVAAELAASGRMRAQVTVLHCGGARPSSEVFASIRSSVRAAGTMHPLRSFVAGRTLSSLHGTAFGIEGDPAAAHIARLLVAQMGGFAYDITADALPGYHAAAALASNYVVALFDAACEALAAAGVPRAEAPSALLPLLRSTTDNLEAVGLPRALTGPVARGDVGAVERHLAALTKGSRLAGLYQVLAERAVTIARDKGEALPEALDAIGRLVETR